MSSADWIDRMRGTEVASVAAALGCAVTDAGSAITVSPCPACHAERRHEGRRDRRGAIGIRRRIPGGWKCHACGITGDALHFVALSLTGKKLGATDEEGSARVRAWCDEFTGGGSAYTPPRRRAPEPPRYAPPDDLRAVWTEAVPVARSADVSRWLAEDRGLRGTIDPRLARVIDAVDPSRDWATFRDGATYPSRGYRLLVPMFDARGCARSLIFRRVGKHDGPKSVPPRGYDRVGLVMACQAAHAMLRGRELPTGQLVIAEGEMDFLAWALSSQASTLGIVSGSWTPELAARIPDGTRVLIATDPDAAGEAYARAIIDSLADRARASRVHLERWKGAAA